MVIGSKQELGLLMKEVEQAKNRYSNRSGFAPVQRQIGHRPRIPNAILSDNVVDPALVDGMCVDDMERLHKMRRVAQKAFCELNAKEGVQRALQARPRVWKEYQAGDLVYVYRAYTLEAKDWRYRSHRDWSQQAHLGGPRHRHCTRRCQSLGLYA